MRREVDDDLYLGIRQQLLDAARPRNIILRGASLGRLHARIGHAHDVKGLELLAVLEVDSADLTASDETDLGG